MRISPALVLVGSPLAPQVGVNLIMSPAGALGVVFAPGNQPVDLMDVDAMNAFAVEPSPTVMTSVTAVVPSDWNALNAVLTNTPTLSTSMLVLVVAAL